MSAFKHALAHPQKNVLICFHSQGRYQLTPLYDVISAYPLATQRQIEWQALKMAMAVKGKNRHYLWSTIQLRHWFAMADKCQFPRGMMQAIVDEVCDNLENVIDQVTQGLPSHFPSSICDSIFTGMRQIRNRCGQSNK